LRLKVEEWISYKHERRENYKPTGLKSLLSEIQNNASKYGDSEICRVISSSMAANYKGIVFDRLKATGHPKGSNNPFLDRLREGVDGHG
jgi:hypothetical protein